MWVWSQTLVQSAMLETVRELGSHTPPSHGRHTLPAQPEERDEEPRQQRFPQVQSRNLTQITSTSSKQPLAATSEQCKEPPPPLPHHTSAQAYLKSVKKSPASSGPPRSRRLLE